jgi:hypothetical protein
MPSLRIIRVETVKRGTNANLFNPFTDPITLRLTTVYSADVFRLAQPRVHITYQILAMADNGVKFTHVAQHAVNPGGVEYYSWVDLGTAHALGLNWTGSQLFGFRGAVELFASAGEAGEVAIDAFDVAPIHWFRLEPIFEV